MPVARLTVANVSTLPVVDGRRTDYVDSLLPGFVLRVAPSGVRTYGVAAWDGHAKRRVTLGRADRMGLGEARARAREVIEALAKRQPVPAAPAQARPLTVEKLVDRCVAALELRPATRREWERIARTEIHPVLGPHRAGELRRAEVREWLRPIVARSGWVANHSFAVLRRAYSWGLREDLVETNPCTGLPKPYEGRANDRVMTATELRALMRALERGASRYPIYADATRLLLLTAVRRAAVLGARRGEFEGLDTKDPRWVVPASRMKSDRDHVVPLSPKAAWVARKRMSETKGDLLFPAGHGAVRVDVAASWAGRWRTWLRLRVERGVRAQQRLAGIPPGRVPRWTIHGLRHTVATHMVEDLGVSQHVVSLILAHAPGGPAVTRIYNRAELLEERRRALRQWAKWLDDLMAPGPWGGGGRRGVPEEAGGTRSNRIKNLQKA